MHSSLGSETREKSMLFDGEDARRRMITGADAESGVLEGVNLTRRGEGANGHWGEG